jgi:CRP-like cAMP-binding protein
VGLTHRLVELTNRLTELPGGRVEGRLARFFLKLAHDMGQRRDGGTFIPLVLSRQELADMIGDVDSNHESMGQGRRRAHREGRIRRRGSRGARSGFADLIQRSQCGIVRMLRTISHTEG